MSPRFTPLESAVVDALVWELGDTAPDLAGQFAESLPGQRRNTGSGLFTEVIVDRTRPAPLTTPTGRFGTVHAMVGDLPDPVAFQVELRAGRLLYLFGDAYGQDTRDIDFATVPFDQVFTVDAHGESVAFDPAALMPPGPSPDPQIHADPVPAATFEPSFVNLDAPRGVQNASPPDPVENLFPVRTTDAAPADAEESRTSLLVGVWVVIAIVALVASLVFRLPLALAVFGAVILARWVQKPAVLSTIQRLVDTRRNRELNPPQS
ncbi:hypothetical protein [Brevundimonas sp.]|uniref:hypothetical protein n=1 Tax=Brevundimonas sp. TaxID=1871086 RepID=UPI002B71698D|nr:hypothetical protein [Brevundimonas sp.]HWQ86247.1 hypothetical protein [Brevundimonas sp.]